MEKGFIGDPWDFFFFRVTTGGGVRRDCFCKKNKTEMNIYYTADGNAELHQIAKKMNPLQSAGLVKYLPTGHLWINPHLSERITYKAKSKTGQDEDLKWKWTRMPTYLSRSFHIAVHEEALNGVGLGHSRFLHVFLCFRSFSTSSPCEWNTLFTSRCIKQRNAANVLIYLSFP